MGTLNVVAAIGALMAGEFDPNNVFGAVFFFFFFLNLNEKVDESFSLLNLYGIYVFLRGNATLY